MDFDICQVFPVGLVFDFKILCRDVADLAAVGGHVNFDGVLFELERGIAYVYWDTREALLENLVMNSRCVCGYAGFAF